MKSKMMNNTVHLIQRRRHQVWWQRAVRVMAMIVVFCTTYALILPAITMTQPPICGKDEHHHQNACYTSQSIPMYTCTFASGIPVIHQHNEFCFDNHGALVCTLPELEGHTHTDACYVSSELPVCDYAQVNTDCYTQEQVLICELAVSEGHRHTDSCNGEERVLVCLEQDETTHIHDDSCYETRQIPCGIPESEGHAHVDTCYEIRTIPYDNPDQETHVHTDDCYPVKCICDKQERKTHTHESSCFNTEGISICQQPEVMEHMHTEFCCTFVESEQELICLMEEHIHQDTCYGQEKDPDTSEYLCSSGEHIHEGSCYDENQNRICSIPEHIHEAACLVADLDMTADIQTPAQWGASMSSVVLTGVWSDDVLSIAQSQLHYQESQRNLVLTDGQLKGYTRYGDWYGFAYGDWDAMFASFCISYAQVKDFPLDSDPESWKLKLEERNHYRSSENYMPKPGDLIFLDQNQVANAPVEIPVGIDRVGIVAALLPESAEHPARFKVITGDYNNRVDYVIYEQDDITIVGFGVIPENKPVILCGLDVHIHSDGCLNESGEEICGIAEHSHTEACTMQQPEESTQEEITEYFCGQDAHIHDETCLNENDEQVCGIAEHSHTEVCTRQQPEDSTQGETSEYICGQQEHQHDAACMNDVAELVCGTAEHIHSDGCKADKTQVTYCEIEEHAHTESCLDAAGQLICAKTVHAHGKDCIVPKEGTYFCGKTEHNHTEECTNEAGELVCQLDAHSHGEECTMEKVPVYICGMEAHSHGEDCRDEHGEMICTLPEHTHQQVCAVMDLDLNADVESKDQWEATLAHVNITGNWSMDTLAIAMSQLGYQESSKNIILKDGAQKGYTRYGAWSGDPYCDWNSRFVSFCLHYAQVTDYPQDIETDAWITKLKEKQLYKTADAYSPKAGELVFFGENQVGIVREILPATEDTPARLRLVAGDQEGKVSYVTLDIQNPSITGYGLIPEGSVVYCCKMEVHTHSATCYDTTGELLCVLPEHTHNINCIGRKLTYADNAVQVEMVLTDNVRLPENLELMVSLVPRENVSEAMSDAIRDTMLDISAIVDDIAYFNMKLTSQGEPYTLPDGIEAQVQVTFAQPMFTPEAITDYSILRTFAVDALSGEEPEPVVYSGLRSAAPNAASDGLMLLKNTVPADNTDADELLLDKQTGYQALQTQTDSYENMAEGVTGMRFSTSNISTFAVALADTSVDGNFWQLVTSDSQLSSNDVFLIVSPEGNYALANNDSMNNRHVNVEMVSSNPGYYTITVDDGSDVPADAQWRFTPNGSNWRIYNQGSSATRYLVLNSSTIFNNNPQNMALEYQSSESAWIISQSNDTRYKLAIKDNGKFYRSDTYDGFWSNPDSLPYQRSVMIFKMSNVTLTIPEDVISSGGNSSLGTTGEVPEKPSYPAYRPVTDGLTGETIHAEVEGSYYSDPATSQLESLFTGVPAHNGRILTDKSVIYGKDDYDAFSTYDANTFGITLSALGQEYTVMEEETVKTPLDVVFVLDVSGSMKESTGNERRIDAMVDAVNSAMATILEGPNNRVGVVLYSSGAWNMLELGRYVQNIQDPANPGSTINNKQYLKTSVVTGGWKDDDPSNPRFQVSGNTGLAVENSVYGGGINQNILNADQANGTYTQAGIAMGARMLQTATQKTYTQVVNKGQNNEQSITVNRQPIIILLSDGEPTHCTSNYKDVLKGPHYGDGLVNSGYQGVYGYYTILSANYYKRQVGIAYNNPAMFYTVGMGISQTGDTDSSKTGYDSDVYKRAVLNPTVNNITNMSSTINPVNTVNQLKLLMGNGADSNSINVSVTNQSYMTSWMGQVHSAVPVLPNPYSSNYSYADKAYFGDIGSQELERIFNEIISENMSFTTSDFVLQGRSAVEIMEPIGEGMEIKSAPILRYGGINYTYTDKTVSGNKTTYVYDYDFHATDGSRYWAKLSTILVEVITDENGLQTVHMNVPDQALPVYVPRIYMNHAGEEITAFYYEALPVRLIYQVGLTAQAQQAVEALKTSGGSLTFYTNRYQNGVSANALMKPSNANPYYMIGSETDHNHGVPKNPNVTGTHDNSFECHHDRKLHDGEEVPWITQELGNNGKLVFESNIQIPVEKYWQEGVDPLMQDPVTIQLYRISGSNAEPLNILTLDNTNEWKGKFEKLPVLDTGFYAVAEITPNGFVATYSKETITVILDGKPIRVVPVESNRPHEEAVISITNLKAYDLPKTGGIGIHCYTIGGLLMLAAALMYGIIFDSRKRRGGRI